MRVLIVNPPYNAFRTKQVGEQVPLGLLAIGGPLLDAGHEVRLLDAQARRLPEAQILREAAAYAPDVILTGHAGSTPAHPTILRMAAALKGVLPQVPIVYGGVHATYHAEDALREAPQIDVVVRGEGEETALRLVEALAAGRPLGEVQGLAYREAGVIRLTAAAPQIADLDACRVGWELIEDWDLYQCWGRGRAAVIQLSRGCPHLCSYCGQRGFWTRQRYRTPEKLAAEIAWLHRTHGVRFVDMADENPTTSPKMFRRFLEAMIAEAVDVRLFATIRAGDVVRDAEILPLYKRAGVDCVLMGMETTDEATLALIRKGSTAATDREALRLLRANGILSMMGHIVGFEEETDRDCWRALRQILLYDPDLLNAMYVTPHRWTPFYAESAERGVIQPDLTEWDYRHQVLSTRRVPPWRLFLWVKATEAIVSLRPKAMLRLLRHPDRAIRKSLRWCLRYSGQVWFEEILDFCFREKRLRDPQPLREARGAPEPQKEYALGAPERPPARRSKAAAAPPAASFARASEG